MNNPFGITPDMLLGKPTFQVPMNLIVQSVEGDKVVGVFQTSMGQQLLMGSQMTHQLIMGDVFVRPRLAFESNDFRGRGLTSLLTNGFTEVDTWMKHPLFDRDKQ